MALNRNSLRPLLVMSIRISAAYSGCKFGRREIVPPPHPPGSLWQASAGMAAGDMQRAARVGSFRMASTPVPSRGHHVLRAGIPQTGAVGTREVALPPNPSQLIGAFGGDSPT